MHVFLDVDQPTDGPPHGRNPIVNVLAPALEAQLREPSPQLLELRRGERLGRDGTRDEQTCGRELLIGGKGAERGRTDGEEGGEDLDGVVRGQVSKSGKVRERAQRAAERT